MKISAVLPDALGAALEERARAEDRSASAVVRRAVAEHLQVAPFSRRLPAEMLEAAHGVSRITISTVRPIRGMLLRMAISLLAIVVIWLLVLLELHDAISS